MEGYKCLPLDEPKKQTGTFILHRRYFELLIRICLLAIVFPKAGAIKALCLGMLPDRARAIKQTNLFPILRSTVTCIGIRREFYKHDCAVAIWKRLATLNNTKSP